MNEDFRALYADAASELLGFPSEDVSPDLECLFRPTFHCEGAMFLFVGDDRPAEIVVRTATASIRQYVDAIVSAASRDLAAVAPPRVVTQRADLDDRSRASLRELLASSLEAPAAESAGGRDGMVVDVVMRAGATTQRRVFVTTDVVDMPLDILVRSAIAVATRLMEHTAAGVYLHAMRGYVR
jgi:hypothetical protein